MEIDFTKMEGTGNDFIVIDALTSEKIELFIKFIPVMCDRHKGIGGDGVIFILPSEQADFKMRIFNSDGSEAGMCGNGVRCFVEYLVLKGLTSSKKIKVETISRIVEAEYQGSGNVKVNMGVPLLETSQIPVNINSKRAIKYPLKVGDKLFEITAVSMGNPHAVIYTDEATDELVLRYGSLIEKHNFFPQRTNVEFVKVISPKEISMRVWERGCGETLACGTGACAAVVSGVINSLNEKRVTVHLKGGDLFVEWEGREDTPVFLTGPAKKVFNGSYFLPQMIEK
ncbi:MAG: diaminopimelate epimerase [Chitinispirillaceae bacterium]|nr:diaminopimelate epimerase [Chitinispirillaceae bacterium]